MSGKRRGASADEIMRCSFCNRSQFEIRRLVAGPKATICDTCVRECVEIVGRDPSPGMAPDEYAATLTHWPTEIHCSLCRMKVSDEEVVAIGKRGVLCAVCVAAIRRELSKSGKR